MKDYKRLTERKGEDIAIDLNACGITDIKDFAHDKLIKEIATRLADLEDKIESGTLIKLPCKIGDMVYEVIKGFPIQEWKVEAICFDRVYPKGVIWAERTRDFAHWKFWTEDCGTKWFATKAEAEAKLRELKGVEEDDR